MIVRPLLIIFSAIFIWRVNAIEKAHEEINFSKVLGQYMKIKDVKLGYQFITEVPSAKNGVRTDTYIFKSQKWPIDHYDDIPQTIWTHRLVIYVPEKILHNQVFLYVNGGYINKGSSHEHPKENADLASIADSTGAIVIELRDIPNQFLIINGVPKKEDQIIAYSFKKFLENPKKNYFIPAYLPMTKSILKAADVLEKLLLEQYKINVEGFVLSGAAKRGWSIWLALLLDSRIKAIVPINTISS